MMEDAGDWLKGQYVDDANKTVTQRLDAMGALLKLEFITHSYPHDWRTKKPIIFRATTQWFASIDKIREKLLTEIANVDWIPKWGQQRMHNMIADRGDWCISRQRAWGVPIPIFYAEDDTPIMDEAVFAHVAELFREHGSNIWFEKEAKELLPQGYTHTGSPNGEFRKETDTMDVWFDSGSSHTGAMMERGLGYPADLYFEGSDQYRGWFNSSLIIGTAVHGHSPYKQVLSHGFVMDGKGVKMSKSQWNAVAPGEITKKYGADILRLWATSVDYQADCSMSDEILKQISEQYRKVPNMLSNLMTNELSAYYMDYTKDILYIEKKDAPRRRQVQTVLWHAVNTLVRLWAPILVHTCEEVNDFFHTEAESIHLGSFAQALDVQGADTIKADMERMMAIRQDIFKALEEARAEKVIGKSLEAHVMINVSDEDRALIEKLCGNHFNQWLIVSKVSFSVDELKQYEVCQVEVEKCEGKVCPRCWNITDSHAEDGLCDRCAEVLEQK